MELDIFFIFHDYKRIGHRRGNLSFFTPLCGVKKLKMGFDDPLLQGKGVKSVTGCNEFRIYGALVKAK
jgi:hypothetical protein